MPTPALAIHGGAGTISRAKMTPERRAAYEQGLRKALDSGYAILERGGSSLDAVEAAVVSLEDCPLFNAGKGSVFSHDGQNEMDASIMCGRTREAGALAAVLGLRNPIRGARKVMEESEHVLLTGKYAARFAELQGMAFEPPEYFHTDERYRHLQIALKHGEVILDHTEDKELGTVGAVAVDVNGDVAAATSTGGMTNKKWGRVGDSPIIGAGTYADNRSCAVSCTGHGEYFMRGVSAFDLHALMQYRGKGLLNASRVVIHQHLGELGGDGGLIAVDPQGGIALPFNSPGMYRGWRRGEESQIGIFVGETAEVE